MADWKGTGLLRNNKPGDVINDVFNASLGVSLTRPPPSNCFV
jgi:hypothetical protein